MGLTIHYDLKSKTRSSNKAKTLVEQFRQLALDIGSFKEVGEVLEFTNPNYDDPELEDHCWLLIQAEQSVSCPWNKNRSRRVSPEKMFAVSIWPGEGCEEMNLGLCLYPKTIDWDYKVEDDQKFQYKDSHNFSYWKFRDYMDRRGHHKDCRSFDEKRKVKTKLTGWGWSSFCKTQYASDPSCGGIANFLACHIGVVTLLDEIAKLSAMEVHIQDEGHYGPDTYSDDWREAREKGVEPTYVYHPGKYDVKDLVEQVGEWNSMIAAMVGGLKDAFGGRVVAPIAEYPNFEQLEFQGGKDSDVRNFLRLMANLAKTQVVETPT